MPHWLVVLEQVGPMVLMFTPLAPIATSVIAGIKAAELIPGATGDQKKALVVQIVAAGVQGTNAQAGHTVLDPAESVAAAGAAVDTIVHVTNVITSAQSAAPQTLTSPSTPIAAQQ